MAAIDVYPAEFRGRKLAFIATPHVLIREHWRGRNLIQKLGLRTFLAARLRHPFRSIYWFFDTLSYKSYLLLTAEFRNLLAASRRADTGAGARRSSTSSPPAPTAPRGGRRAGSRCAPGRSACATPPPRWS